MHTLVAGNVARFYIAPAAALEATRGALEGMGHPTRQRILALLMGEPKGLPYGEIARRLGFEEPSSIDQHLKVLTGAILVANLVGRVNGRIRSIYSITDWGKEWMERCEFTDPEQLKLLLAGTRTVA
jgi:DNA-binding transcriptional ArsR family regulator